MNNRTSAVVLAATLAVLPLMACTQAEKAVTTVQSAAEAQVNPTLSTRDASFLNGSAASGIAEVQLGELAAKRASSPAVRRFAQQMVSDHSQANAQLMQLAHSKQISPSTTLDAAHQQTLDRLQGLKGRAFDKAYVDGQVDDHQTTLDLFQGEAQNGTDPDVKAFAANNAGIIQQHLNEAKRLAAAYTARHTTSRQRHTTRS